ncbi:MAG: hypothetical protein LBK61_11020 [Spirochaetaceae bacterium]|nr:hypothetical protein [Spirochaetaceae bacterium]
MTAELIVVIAIVAAAAVFFVIKAVRLFRGEKPSCCDGGKQGKGRCSRCKQSG